MIKQQAEVIIVGGGSTGAAIQCFLVRAGIGATLLVERGMLAGGPTGRSPAIFRQHYGHPELVKMARYGIEYFRDWSSHSHGTCDYVTAPLLSTVGEENAKEFAATLALMRNCNVQIDEIAPDDICKLIPGVWTGDVVAASMEPNAGYCDPHATVWSFAAEARRHGGSVLQFTPVTELLVRANRICGIRTVDSDIAAPIVILAAGPWTSAMAAQIGVTLPIKTRRHSLAQIVQPPSTAWFGLMYADYITGLYFRPEGKRQFLAGSLLPWDNAEIVNPDRFDEGVSQETFISIAQRIVHRLPQWSDAGDGGGWSSLLDVTPDGYPVIGEVDGIDGLYIVAGLSGHGFKLCPAIAEMLTALVTGIDSAFDTNMFALNRFERNKPIIDLTSYRYEFQRSAAI